MEELKELIGEGEYIRSDIANSMNTGADVTNHWSTVVRWYSEALKYAKMHSHRPVIDFPEYLDDMEPGLDAASRKQAHYERIDRLLNRLRGIQACVDS